MRVKSNKKSDFSRYFGIKEGISLVLCASFILLSAALVSPLVSLIPQKSQRKSFSASKRRNAVNKYIESR